jgi:hypothetical protein
MKKIMIVLIMLLFITSLCFYLYQKKTKKEFEQVKNTLEFTSLNCKIISELYGQIYRYDGKKINNVVLENQKSIKNSLIDIIGDSIKLIFYLPKASCTSCVDQEIENILVVFNSVLIKNSILVISEFENLRLMKVFVNKTGFSNTFNLVNDSLGLKLDKNMIASFIVDRNLKISCFFTPQRSFPNLSNQYYVIIKDRIINDPVFNMTR